SNLVPRAGRVRDGSAVAHRRGIPMTGRLIRFPSRPIAAEEVENTAEKILAIPAGERPAKAEELHLEEPEVLLSLSARPPARLPTAPAVVRDEAEFLSRFLLTPERPIGLFDEREYFRGELALICGTACRQLSRREESRLWFDRSEAGFRHTMNAVADL